MNEIELNQTENLASFLKRVANPKAMFSFRKHDRDTWGSTNRVVY